MQRTQSVCVKIEGFKMHRHANKNKGKCRGLLKPRRLPYFWQYFAIHSRNISTWWGCRATALSGLRPIEPRVLLPTNSAPICSSSSHWSGSALRSRNCAEHRRTGKTVELHTPTSFQNLNPESPHKNNQEHKEQESASLTHVSMTIHAPILP